MTSIQYKRALRSLRDALSYPLWTMRGKPSPDNHHFKVARILRLRRTLNIGTLIETGTFFGQTVSASLRHFDKVFSVELSERLYNENRASFREYKNVAIYLGDSSSRLGEMIESASGRILYWLDGHYSDGVTARGKEVTPILEELRIIKSKGRQGDCILIDDIRLFTGRGGYPAVGEVTELLKSIQSDYLITQDHDCLIATPKT